MKCVLTFETKEIFQADVREIVDRYFKGERTGHESADALGWRRDQWDRAMSGIFSAVLRGGKRSGLSVETT